MKGASHHVTPLPATPRIAPVAAQLLYLTMGPLAEYWMGVENRSAAEVILARLFCATRNLFSHEFAEYVEIGGQTAGLVLGYPATTMKRLEPMTLLKFLGAAGLRTSLRMVVRSYPLQSITDADSDEYFLAHLGVLPEFEGRGLGRLMLERAIENARRAGLRKITLTVDAENGRAIGLYTRAGFSVTSTIELEPLRRHFSYHGFHHMAKTLAG